MILLMAEILHHPGCMKPCKQWEMGKTTNLNWFAGFQPSTVLYTRKLNGQRQKDIPKIHPYWVESVREKPFEKDGLC